MINIIGRHMKFDNAVWTKLSPCFLCNLSLSLTSSVGVSQTFKCTKKSLIPARHWACKSLWSSFLSMTEQQTEEDCLKESWLLSFKCFHVSNENRLAFWEMKNSEHHRNYNWHNSGLLTANKQENDRIHMWLVTSLLICVFLYETSLLLSLRWEKVLWTMAFGLLSNLIGSPWYYEEDARCG
jgi:hypothetical protein